jgi:very-short-patch-repair endonuclease
MALPYNPALKQRAKELRRAGSLSEALFWNQVKGRRFLGLDFDRQKIIGNYIVDFFCAEINVIIEIDGISHDQKADYDAARDAFLKRLGLSVIHLSDSDVKVNLEGVMQWLRRHPAFDSNPGK